MRGLIVEGVTGSGKSRVLAHLQRQLAEERPANTKIILSEHYTERVLEELREHGSLTELQVLDHLHTLLDMLTPLRHARARSKFAERAGNVTVFVLVERFLLGQVAHMRAMNASSWSPTPELRAAIARLGAAATSAGLRFVVLCMSADVLRGRVLSTLRHRGDAWRRFAHGLGDDEAVVAHYDRQQRLLLEFCGAFESELTPTLVDVNADESDARCRDLARDLHDRFLASGVEFAGASAG